MKMRKLIIFILIFIKNIFCDESNESKYIDQLPQEEKEQFLQKIAKRIFKEAEVTDENSKKSREVTDDQLNEHTDFVEKLLREESINLRKQSRDDRENEYKSEEPIRVKSLLRDKLSNERVDYENGVDLTIRQGGRKKRRDNPSADIRQNKGKQGNILVDVKYNTDENKMIENSEKSKNLLEAQSLGNPEELVNKKEQSSFEDIQVKYFKRNHETSNKNTDEIELMTNNSQITQMSDFDKDSKEKNSNEHTTVKQYSQNTDKTAPTILSSAISENDETSSIRFTETISETRNAIPSKSKANETIEKTTERALSFKEPSTINSSYIQPLNGRQRILRSEVQEFSKVNITNDRIYITNENMQKSTPPIYEQTTQNSETIEHLTLYSNSATTTEYSPNITYGFKKSKLNDGVVYTPVNVDDTTESSTIILESKKSLVTDHTLRNRQHSEKTLRLESSLSKQESDFKVNENTIDASTLKSLVTGGTATAETEVAGDIVKALRKRLLEDNEDTFSAYSKRKSAKYKNSENKEGYNVYEIHTNQDSFTINHVNGRYKNQEQPHYVPIYNYSPNNAYFNAQNRYGPNSDNPLQETNSDIDFNGMNREDILYFNSKDIRTLKDGQDNRKFRFGNRDTPKRQHNLPQIMIPVVNQKEHFSEIVINPDDYLDTDYYLGRTNSYFKAGRRDKTKNLRNSQEGLHSGIDTVKDHIRSVRKYLFKNKIFGYIPPINGTVGDVTPPPKPLRVTKAPPFSNLKRNSNKNISVDYYFGRMSLEDEYDSDKTNTKVGYVKYNYLTQDLYITEDMPEELMKRINVIKYADQLFFREDTINVPIKPQTMRDTTKKFNLGESPENYDTMKKVSKLTNEVDLFVALEKLHSMNISHTRNLYISDYVSVYLEVLADILETDNKPFVQYDWLGTTVDIQSALRRLMDMTELVHNKIVLHPADLGLLKYVVYLFQTAKTLLYLEEDQGERNVSRMGVILPRNRKRKPMFLKEKGLLNRVWLFKRENKIETGLLNEFDKFLNDMEATLFDLHSAIKYIALISKSVDQTWFRHLQKIYMKNDKKHLVEVTLHLSASRLFGLIEECATNGVETNMVDYIRNNEKLVGRSIDEFVFVLKLLDENKYLGN